MLNFFFIKIFLMCQVFLFLLYFFIITLTFTSFGSGLRFFLLKKKTKNIILVSFWFLAFLPLSAGFFYKFFIFLTGFKVNLYIFLVYTILNSIILLVYFFTVKNSFIFFKNLNINSIKYSNYFIYTFNCFFFLILFFIVYV